MLNKFRGLVVMILVCSAVFTGCGMQKDEVVEVETTETTEESNRYDYRYRTLYEFEHEDLVDYLAIEKSGILDDTVDIEYSVDENDELCVSYVYINTTDGHRYYSNTRMEYIERVLEQNERNAF
jgi:hypothetical protein